MNEIPTLRRNTLQLRAPEEPDWLACTKLADDDALHRIFRTNASGTFSESQAKDSFNSLGEDSYYWMIEAKGRLVGIALMDIDSKKSGEYFVGVFRDGDFLMGYAADATQLVMEFALRKLKLSRFAINKL